MLEYKTGEDFYNKMHFRFNALIALSLLPFSLVFLELKDNPFSTAIITGNIAYALCIIAIAAIIYYSYLSFQEVKFFKKNIDKSSLLREKLDLYYKVYIQHFIILCSFEVLITGLLYLTEFNILIVCYVLILVLLSLNRPTLKTIIEQLKLSKEEQNIMFEKLEIDK